MSDSFFTTRNPFDEQITGGQFHMLSCEQLLDATARRIVQLQGPLVAAGKLQRVADICAGAYVLPIDHWRQPPIATPAAHEPEPRKVPRWERVWTASVGNPGVVFWTGFFVGLWWAGVWR